MPRRVRPKLPEEWHVSEEPKAWITWKHADKKLHDEKVYWVSTASVKGRPHSAPVWGIWRDESFYFETDPQSPKGRNLRANPKIVFHVQDGMDTVIVGGSVKREKDSRKLQRLAAEYVRKYDCKPGWSNEKSQIVFRVTPRIAHAWRAPRMHRSLVKFVF